MNVRPLIDTANALLSHDKGLLAMDENTPTCNKRFAALGIPQTEEARRSWRELLITAPGLGESIGGVILYDETIRQSQKDGTSFIKILIDAGIIPGIKVDAGAKDMAGHPGEKITEGLDGLRERLAEYFQMGARFAKWRVVISIGEGIPSRSALEANARALARYAALCQEAGLVPIVEPEVLMGGGHTMERSLEVTQEVLRNVFIQLNCQRVLLEGMILKPNMVLPGLASGAAGKVCRHDGKGVAMTESSTLEISGALDRTHLVGIAADHGGFALKEYLVGKLSEAGAEVVDFGDKVLAPEDDYPDFVVPLARAVVSGEVERGVAICGSGVGACIAANKIPGVRACLIHDSFSAHQGVEDDDLNLICLGGLVVGQALAWELVRRFLCAEFSGEERHRRRLEKVASLEHHPYPKSSIAPAKTETSESAASLKLHLFRHGETAWSLTGQHTGRTGLPLTALGEDEARNLGLTLKGIPFSHVLTSPLKRARRTCELADLEPTAGIDADLAEWNYGDYEGQRSEDIREKNPDWNLFRDGCPNGESPEQVLERADRLIARLRTLEGNVALFSHGQFGGVLAARWIGLPPDAARHFPLGTASHSILGSHPHHPEVPVIERWNEASCTNDRMLLKRDRIESWENEGGEIPDDEDPPA